TSMNRRLARRVLARVVISSRSAFRNFFRGSNECDKISDGPRGRAAVLHQPVYPFFGRQVCSIRGKHPIKATEPHVGIGPSELIVRNVVEHALEEIGWCHI